MHGLSFTWATHPQQSQLPPSKLYIEGITNYTLVYVSTSFGYALIIFTLDSTLTTVILIQNTVSLALIFFSKHNIWQILCYLQANVSQRAGSVMATLTVRTAQMKIPVSRPSASHPSIPVPTMPLCASPPTRSATARWTVQTVPMKDLYVVMFAQCRKY